MDFGPALRALVNVVMVLLALCWLTEDRVADASIAYSMATLHDVFWLSLKAYKAIDVGLQQLPVLTISLQALLTECSSRLATILHLGKHGYDMRLNISTDQFAR